MRFRDTQRTRQRVNETEKIKRARRSIDKSLDWYMGQQQERATIKREGKREKE